MLARPKESNRLVLVPFNTDDLLTFKVNSEQKIPSVVHSKIFPEWNQLKTLLTEIQFLNVAWSNVLHPKPVLVYVGAAPGSHIYPLVQLFPWFEYHLYDTGEFDPRLEFEKNGI